MLLIAIIGIALVLLEAAAIFKPADVTLRKTLKLTVRHSDGYDEKLRIRLKNGENRTYRLTPDTDAFIEQKGSRLYICTPDRSRLFPVIRYRLSDGMSVKVRRTKPIFAFTAMYVAAVLVFNSFGKPIIKGRVVDAFTSSAIPVLLTHENEELIDFAPYEGIHNYLIVGTDQRQSMQTPHADVIILLSFNENTNSVSYCSLLRDVYTEMRDRSTVTIDDLDPSLPNYQLLVNNVSSSQWMKAKLNYAVNLQYIDAGEHTPEERFAEGLNSLVNTVEYTFRIPIEGVISASWEEFITVVDSFGGVELDITEDMLISESEDGKPIGIKPVLESQNRLYGYDDHIEAAGLQKLNGNMSLAYVRLRYVAGGANSDIERTGRIRNFVYSFVTQKRTELFKLADSERISAVSKGIYSSLSEEQTEKLIDMVLTLPTPVDKGTLPYSFHDKRIDGVDYICVDGKNEPRMDVQARALLCTEQRSEQ
ncbi:MAG: LCP family protein [Ruminococcus sp.]|nr:LCP family protein [Ruminococcus sp.]